MRVSNSAIAEALQFVRAVAREDLGVRFRTPRVEMLDLLIDGCPFRIQIPL
jgi:hypothetical protein